jgi:hypothetical protein
VLVVSFCSLRCTFPGAAPTIFDGEVACIQCVRFKPPSRQKTPSLEDNGGISLLSYYIICISSCGLRSVPR